MKHARTLLVIALACTVTLTTGRTLGQGAAVPVSQATVRVNGASNIPVPSNGAIPYGLGSWWSLLTPGTDGNVLTLSGGLPSWQAAASPTPGGVSGSVQFNLGGAFSGDAGFGFLAFDTGLSLRRQNVTDYVTDYTFAAWLTSWYDDTGEPDSGWSAAPGGGALHVPSIQQDNLVQDVFITGPYQMSVSIEPAPGETTITGTLGIRLGATIIGTLDDATRYIGGEMESLVPITSFALQASDDFHGVVTEARLWYDAPDDLIRLLPAQGIELAKGAVEGYVLTSDANGLGTWQAPAAGTTPAPVPATTIWTGDGITTVWTIDAPGLGFLFLTINGIVTADGYGYSGAVTPGGYEVTISPAAPAGTEIVAYYFTTPAAAQWITFGYGDTDTFDVGPGKGACILVSLNGVVLSPATWSFSAPNLVFASNPTGKIIAAFVAAP